MTTHKAASVGLTVLVSIAVTAVVWRLLPLIVDVSTAEVYQRPYGPHWDIRFSDVPAYLTVFFAVLAINTGVIFLFRIPSREFVVWCSILAVVPTFAGLLGYFGTCDSLRWYHIKLGTPPDDPYAFTPRHIKMLWDAARARVYIGIAGSALSIPLMVITLFRARQKANHAVEPTRALSGASGSP